MPRFNAAACLQELRGNLPKPTGFLGRLLGSPAKEDLIPDLNCYDDPLFGFWNVQRRLLREGQLVWSALIQANMQLHLPGNQTLPGEVVASFDSYFDSHPRELHAVAERVYQLKGTRPRDPELRRIAERITNEMHRSLGERLPDQITDGWEVFRYTVLFFPEHLPHKFLSGRLIPLLVLPECGHAMVLPHWYWSEELLELWNPKREQTSKSADQETRRKKTPVVRLSRRALEMIWQVVESQAMDPLATFVRLKIDGSGVTLSFDRHIKRGDHQTVIDGLTFVVDSQTATNHWGSRIDFVDRGTVRGFTVDF